MRILILSITIFLNPLHGKPGDIAVIPSQHTVILSAVTEALHNKDIEDQRVQDKDHCRYTKKQVACFAAASGLCTTVITAVTALAIAFSTCSKS